MLYTLGQAAKAVGKAKGTIKNAIEKGRLSASKDEKGHYRIDPAELHRVYNALPIEQGKLNDITPPVIPPENDTAIKALEDKVHLLEQTLNDVRADRDEWRKQAQTLAITDQRASAGRGFFGLFRKS